MRACARACERSRGVYLKVAGGRTPPPSACDPRSAGGPRAAADKNNIRTGTERGDDGVDSTAVTCSGGDVFTREPRDIP